MLQTRLRFQNMKCVVSGKDNGPSWRKPIAPPCWMSPCAKYPLFYPR